MDKMKVLIADDEPFIVEGLKVLINWEEEGFEIVKTAGNGKEAYEYLLENPVDLVLADIQMPEMSGMRLIEAVRSKGMENMIFVFISGYSDFEYARKAICNGCLGYLLKPVQKEELLQTLRQATQKKQEYMSLEEREQMEKLCLGQSMAALVRGRFDNQDVENVRKKIQMKKNARFVHVSMNDMTMLEEMAEDEVKDNRSQILESCREYLGEYADYCFADLMELEQDYEAGFFFFEEMAAARGCSPEAFLYGLLESARRAVPVQVVLLVGKRVEDFTRISKSYSTACVLHSFQGFWEKRDIYYYDKEVQVHQAGVVLCKNSLDRLVAAVEQNDVAQINGSVDELFREMNQMGMADECVTMNTNYLLFQFIHLAVEQDESVNQEEVLRFIGESVFETGIARGSKAHLRRFACEYAAYLIQLRQNVSRGVLLEVEKEIKEHYADNLTLRELAQKFFINSAYLGQMFRKKYGESFKDYLNNYRINEAAGLLMKTDKRIVRIAEEVGYRDVDYFVSRFIDAKGCSPTKYRKQNS